MKAKKILELRQRQGKQYRRSSGEPTKRRLSSEALVRAYQLEADRQRLIIQRAEITKGRLLFITQALKTLLRDENFRTLLRAEQLETMPSLLADLVMQTGR